MRFSQLHLAAVMFVASLAGCRCEPVVRPTTGGLEVFPTTLEFGPVFVGAKRVASVTLTNTGLASLDVTASTEAPFSTAPALRLGGGESFTLEVEFTPPGPGEVEGRLRVAADATVFDVTLLAVGLAPLSCQGSQCQSSVFDPVQGVCVTATLADDSPCAPGCGASGQCVRGVCLAQSGGSCDDGDPCTIDACGADGGCVAVPRICPVSDRCQLASCQAGVGCVEQPVEDGLACGEATCATAQICLGGRCIGARTPDADRQCTYVDVSAHDDTSCALNVAGRARCWGANPNDQLLRGAPSNGESPGVWPVGFPVASFTGGKYPCAVSASGRVVCPGIPVDAGTDLWTEFFPVGGCGGPGGPSGLLKDGGLVSCLSHPALVDVGPVSQLAVSLTHACALKADGGGLCFGTSPGSFLDGGTSPAAAHIETAAILEIVPTFDRNTCTLDPAGAVTCWGLRPGQTPRPTAPWKKIAPRSYGNITYGHRTDGRVDRCIQQADGGIPNAWQTCELLPDAGPFVKIAVGNIHGCGLTDAGEVACWGYNPAGQLGTDGLPLAAVRRDGGDVAWYEGTGFTMETAFKDGGVVTAPRSGSQPGSQLSTAFRVDDLCGNLIISEGALFSFDAMGVSTRIGAVPTDASLEQALIQTFGTSCCTFSASQGMASTCREVPSVATREQLRAWQRHDFRQFECGVLMDGGVVCSGDPRAHQLGLADAGATSGSPVLPAARSLELVNSGACALTLSGEVWCWGDSMGRTEPSPIPGLLRPVRQLECGDLHCCALTGSNGVQCWGDNSARQLGSAGPSTFVPRRVAIGGPVTRLSRFAQCVVLTTGEVECWGNYAREGLTQSEAPIRVIH
ncbi:MAG: hypothetical protein Q8N23_14920 [Archangium sp.]|nr:hypothetical protein [Archangium sp.]MDP3153963.1 hypothetical protein [Archangium sp.]MDP3574238.1 hypothetical protein [Archangium sp.]